jgi:hypothetical protein
MAEVGGKWAAGAAESRLAEHLQELAPLTGAGALGQGSQRAR